MAGIRGRVRKLLGVLALGLAAAAATAGAPAGGETDTPKLPYTAYAPDERLTLKGDWILGDSEAAMAAALKIELARVRAAQSYEVKPAIWKIGDADTTVYIFGTVHSLPPGFRWRNTELEKVIVSADLLLLESTDDESDDVTFLEGISSESLATLPPLLDRVSHRSRAKLAALQAIMPDETRAQMDKMPTWIAAMGIGFIKDLAAGDMPTPGADDWLEKHFRAIGKPVEAIEDSAEVVTNLNAVPESAQRLMLEAALAAPARTHEQLDGPAHAWAQGDVGPYSPLIITPQSLDPRGALADPILVRRNNQWVDTLLGKIMARPGTVLFAAGAGHFVGPGSVIDLLTKRGIRVERVQ